MFTNRLCNRLLPIVRVMTTGHSPMCSGNELRPTKNKKEVVEHTITEEDVYLFSKITGDFNIIHFNFEEKRGIVHGALLNGIVSGVIGTKLPGHGTVVLSQTLNFPKPCFVGDTVLVTVEIEEIRKITTCKYVVVNKSSKSVVMEGSAKLLFKS